MSCVLNFTFIFTIASIMNNSNCLLPVQSMLLQIKRYKFIFPKHQGRCVRSVRSVRVLCPYNSMPCLQPPPRGSISLLGIQFENCVFPALFVFFHDCDCVIYLFMKAIAWMMSWLSFMAVRLIWYLIETVLCHSIALLNRCSTTTTIVPST